MAPAHFQESSAKFGARHLPGSPSLLDNPGANRQAEPGTTTGRGRPMKSVEHAIPLSFWDPRSAVLDSQ